MNRVFNFIIIFLVLAIIVVAGFLLFNNKTILATNISISESILEMFEGEEKYLTVTITPSTITNQTITWTSSNDNVAIVNQNGVVTAKEKGESFITASIDNKQVQCKVTVKNKEIIPPQGIQVTAKEILLSTTSLVVNKEETSSFSIKASNVACVVSVTSSDTNIISISPNSDDCYGDKCFFDAETNKDLTITYNIKGIAQGIAYINVTLTDCARYSDIMNIQGSGKIGVLVP